MKQFLLMIITILVSSLTSLSSMAAVKVVECEDEQGNRSFQTSCPPGSDIVNEKKLSTGKGSGKTLRASKSANINATLYTAPNCEACDEIKTYLKSRNIAITEKDANEDIEIQKELTELTGSLKVPTVMIGEQTITGYNRSELKAALEANGYVEEVEEGEEGS
jgi:glutaredoxin